MSVVNLSRHKNSYVARLREILWIAVLRLCDVLWAARVRDSRLCLAGYKAARELSQPVVAEEWIDRGLTAAAPHWQLLRGKGDCHRQRAEWTDAQLRYSQAVDSAPRQAALHALLARALMHC